ncbi:hypothetical protein [Nocardia fluminea]|uniref:hypothetical protein n=1 Tax=Nocardia fluminea TaxID=134984 RepID=UPI0037AC139C
MKRVGVVVAVCALLVAMSAAVGPALRAQAPCVPGVDLRPVAITVDGERATGRVYEPYRCVPGDIAATKLVVAVHGHGGVVGGFRPVHVRARAHGRVADPAHGSAQRRRTVAHR